MSQIKVLGPANVLIGASDCTTLTFPSALTSYKALGMSQRGVQVNVNVKTHRVTSDDCGGQEGVPAEMLIMGEEARISLQLVKYNADAWTTIRTGIYSPTTEGAYPLPGTPLFEGAYGMSLIIQGAAFGLYFPKVELASAPREYNISSTETITSVTFNAYSVTSATSGTASGQILYIPSSTGTAGFETGCADAIGGSVTS